MFTLQSLHSGRKNKRNVQYISNLATEKCMHVLFIYFSFVHCIQTRELLLHISDSFFVFLWNSNVNCSFHHIQSIDRSCYIASDHNLDDARIFRVWEFFFKYFGRSHRWGPDPHFWKNHISDQSKNAIKILLKKRVGLSWEWIGLKVEVEGEGYSYFCIKYSLYGCDLLDNRIGRLHTNFQVSATLSKKVLIFSANFIHFHF